MTVEDWGTTHFRRFSDFDAAFSDSESVKRLNHLLTSGVGPPGLLRDLAISRKWLPAECTHEDVEAWHNKIKNDSSMFVIVGSAVVRDPAFLYFPQCRKSCPYCFDLDLLGDGIHYRDHLHCLRGRERRGIACDLRRGKLSRHRSFRVYWSGCRCRL
jgi:hypothetical protein